MTDEMATKILSKLDVLSDDVKILRADTSKTNTNVQLLTMRMTKLESDNKIVRTELEDIKTGLKDVNTDLEEVKSGFTDVQGGFANMQSEIAGMKTGLQNVNTELRDIHTELGDVKAEQKAAKDDAATTKEMLVDLKYDVRRLEVLHEETKDKIESILEIATPTLKTTIKHRGQSKDHEDRIVFLEKLTA